MSIRDRCGRLWGFRLDVNGLRRVRSLTGIDLLTLADPESDAAVKLADPCTVADVLYALCRHECDALGLSADQFIEGLDGDHLAAAVELMLEAIVEFLPEPLKHKRLIDEADGDEQTMDTGELPSAASWRLVTFAAGVLGIDPGPLTLRELMAMANERLAANWDHTCQIMALLANINRDPKKQRKPFNGAEMNPYRSAIKGKKRPAPKAPISVLKDVFVREKAK